MLKDRGFRSMSKYNKLWEYVSDSNQEKLVLSYRDIEKIAEQPVDHSFLTYKKELLEYGYKVGKISVKKETIEFIKEGKHRLQ